MQKPPDPGNFLRHWRILKDSWPDKSLSREKQDSADVQLSRLPAGFRRALERELCPGEAVELIINRPRDGTEVMRLFALVILGVMTSLSLAVGAVGGMGYLTVFALVAGVSALLDRFHQRAYVLTNQRCFLLVTLPVGVSVRDVSEVPSGLRLPGRELMRLRDGIWALERSRQAGKTPGDGVSAPIARNLSAAHRRAVDRALMPGEVLRWAERPNAKRYFANAPLDAPTAFGFIGGFVGLMIGAGSMAMSQNPTMLAIGAGMVTAAASNLWRQVRGTVYAVTDRRGLVINPGGRVRSYDPDRLRRFQRVQDGTGRGTLAPPGSNGEGFYGLQNAKLVDDLIKQRTPRDASTELAPAEAQPGRGDELGPA